MSKNASSRGIRLASLAASTLLLCASHRAEAQRPPANEHAPPKLVFPANPEDTVPAVFSFSGGISLGSYQAGVNWAVVEFLKLLRDSSQYRREELLPVIQPVVMTGASAGNINVLLGSIEYCDQTSRKRPESSLFWKMWVETGWDQLLPHQEAERDSLADDRGVLDRGAIRKNVLAAIDRAMSGNDSVRIATDTLPRLQRFAACHVPIGVVATRVAAGRIARNPEIIVPNQRYVGLFTVASLGQGLALFGPDGGLIEDPAMGAQMVLPTDPYGRIAPARAYDLVEASAAYPVAFAPKVLTYMDASCVANPGRAGCSDLHHESFLDGGVFDNYPVSLAVEMQRRLSKPHSARPVVFYVDPGLLRGALASHDASHSPPLAETQVTGINALLRFAGSFVPSARSYELQTFIRQQLGASQDGAAVLMSSTRGHPVVGEHLGAFAAFLGRPFRETDFFIGVADGLHFVAADVLCSPSRLGDQEYRTKQHLPEITNDKLDHETSLCVDTATTALARYGFGLDTVGQRVVDAVLAREIAGVRPKYPLGKSESALTAERTKALFAVEEATYERIRDDRPFECPSGDLAELILCFDGFDRILGSLSARQDVVDIITDWNDAVPCQADSYDASRCLAETDLVGFLTDPHTTMQANLNRVLRQLRNAEERSKDAGDREYKPLVKTIELLYRSTNQQGRRGPEPDPSSVSPNDGLWELLHVLPYRYGGYLGRIGMELAWQPTWNFGACQLRIGTVEHCYAYVSLPFGYDRLPVHYDPSFAKTGDYAMTSLVVGHNFSRMWLNQLGIGVRAVVPKWNATPPLMPEVSGSFMLGKLHVTLFRVPESQWPTHRPHLLGIISLADLNGLLYWMLR